MPRDVEELKAFATELADQHARTWRLSAWAVEAWSAAARALAFRTWARKVLHDEGSTDRGWQSIEAEYRRQELDDETANRILDEESKHATGTASTPPGVGPQPLPIGIH